MHVGYSVPDEYYFYSENWFSGKTGGPFCKATQFSILPFFTTRRVSEGHRKSLANASGYGVSIRPSLNNCFPWTVPACVLLHRQRSTQLFGERRNHLVWIVVLVL